MGTRRYLLAFAQVLEEFQLPELHALLDLFKLSHIQLEQLPSTHQQWPIAVLSGAEDNDVMKVMSRSILVKHAYEIVVEGDSYEQLHSSFKQKYSDTPGQYFIDHQSYCFRVKSIGRKTKQNYALQRIEEFEYMPINAAAVCLDHPDVEYHLIEFYNQHRQTESQPQYVYLARFVGRGQYELADRYSLKRRLYIGNTTMDPRAALLQVNMAHVHPGALVLDPFAGTGGILLMAGHFGALCLGVEINWQIAHGIGKSSRVTEGRLKAEQCMQGNFIESGLGTSFGGVVLADTSKHTLWRHGLQFDAIVCDPPYGLREKCQKIGTKQLKPGWIEKEQTLIEEMPQHYPQKTSYDSSDVFVDLVSFAAERLKVGGRLAYWLPCTKALYSVLSVPSHPCLRLMANCEQQLCSRTSRRLIVMHKHRPCTVDDGCATVQTNMHNGLSYRNAALKLDE